VGDAHCLLDDIQHNMDGDDILSTEPGLALLSDEQEARFPPVTSQTPLATPTRLKSPHTPNVVPVVWPATPTTNISRGQDGTGVYLGGHYSYDDLVAFGGITEKFVEVQASDRIRHQHNADATQMERAQQLAATKNCGSYAGTHSCSKFSLSSILDASFLSRTLKLGVCLGASNDEITATILNIKKVIMREP
jgi:hypothetical protein